MAGNLIRNVYHRVKRIVNHTFAAKRVLDGHRANNTANRQQAVKARVHGVRATTRQVTSGNRSQRAQQLKGMRANPHQRQQLRRRVKFKTRSP